MSVPELLLLTLPAALRSPVLAFSGLLIASLVSVEPIQFKSVSLAQKIGATFLFPIFWKSYLPNVSVLSAALLPLVFGSSISFHPHAFIAVTVSIIAFTICTQSASLALPILVFACLWRYLTREGAFTFLETAVLAQAASLSCTWLVQTFAAAEGLSGGTLAASAVTATGLATAAAFATSSRVLAVIASACLAWTTWKFLPFVYSLPHSGSLTMYWTATLVMTLPAVVALRPHFHVVVVRKFFHAVALLLFGPPLVVWPESRSFVAQAGWAVCVLLVGVEVARQHSSGVARKVTPLIFRFLDAKKEKFVISHTALLVGCLLPVWMSEISGDRTACPLYGLAAVGVADALAAVVGVTLKRPTRMPWTTSTSGATSGNRSVEGFLGFVASALVCCWGMFDQKPWLLARVVALSLLESYTDSLDNLLLPIYFRIL